MKPKLKPPGTMRLKLEYDGLLLNFGFKSNLCRYTMAGGGAHPPPIACTLSAHAERLLWDWQGVCS
jgi:hypothetical protein